MLSLEQRPLANKAFSAIDDEIVERGLLRVSVQPFSRWGGGRAREAGLPREADVFVMQDPCLVGILALVGTASDTRHTWHEWPVKQSDVGG